MLKIGDTITVHGITGRLVAIAYLGERYYFLESKDGTISMLPAL